MSGIPDREATQKAARALELFEKGLEPHVIAERLGLQSRHVNEIIKRAKTRRERFEAELRERTGDGQ